MELNNLEELQSDVFRCATCGRDARGPWDPFPPRGPTPDRICPSYEMYKSLGYAAQGYISVARALLEGKIEPSTELIDHIYQCLMCGSCEKCCEQSAGVPILSILQAMRADLVANGYGPSERFKKTAAAIKSKGNRFGLPQEKRSNWIPEGMSLPQKGDLLFFAGCVSSFREPETAQAVVKILDKVGITPAYLGENEWCCGGPTLFETGQMEQFKTVVSHNVEAIRAAGAKEVIIACACGYKTFKIDYPEVVGNLGFKVTHISEYLARLVENGTLKLNTPRKEVVTYHDPCQLGRSTKIYAEPRKVLEAVPELELVEIEGNKELTLCCGRYHVELPEVSGKAASDRLNDAKATGAKTLITSCSFCKWNLKHAADSEGADMKVVDLVEVVSQSMGL